MDIEKKYPNLFKEVTWPWGPTRARFVLLNEIPPSELIANINIVPQSGKSWVVLQLQDGSWDVPGGTIENGESYIEALQRELREEAGARFISFALFGAWHCLSLATKPYRSHLPHPESYRLVGVGDVEIIRPPTNPKDGEKIIKVESVPLREAIGRFEAVGRHDLAELYGLGAEARDNSFGIEIEVV